MGVNRNSERWLESLRLLSSVDPGAAVLRILTASPVNPQLKYPSGTGIDPVQVLGIGLAEPPTGSFDAAWQPTVCSGPGRAGSHIKYIVARKVTSPT